MRNRLYVTSVPTVLEQKSVSRFTLRRCMSRRHLLVWSATGAVRAEPHFGCTTKRNTNSNQNTFAPSAKRSSTSTNITSLIIIVIFIIVIDFNSVFFFLLLLLCLLLLFFFVMLLLIIIFIIDFSFCYSYYISLHFGSSALNLDVNAHAYRQWLIMWSNLFCYDPWSRGPEVHRLVLIWIAWSLKRGSKR